MLDIKKFVINENYNQFAKIFFDNNSLSKKYIMGMSKDGHSKELSLLVDIDGFIDDFTNEKDYLGKPICTTDEIKKDSIIVVCSTVRTRTALNKLSQKGFTNIIAYPTLFRYAKDINLPLKIIKEFDTEFKKNKLKYNRIYNMLKDPVSKKIMQNLLNYRATAELDYMKDFYFDPIGQYFEDFLNLSNDEVFIDVGGYDGQTSLEFIKHCPNYKSIYIFEPLESNILLAKENLKNNKNIYFIPEGLSNKKEILRFDISAQASASKISENGTFEINVDTLDNLVDEKVTFIKMDIEGAEGLAIEGMKNHILQDHPKMAISVYHKVDDFWKISEQILNIRDDYDLYMRHYTEGTDETVMFFIPREA